jgi:TPR repeat protein
VKRLLAAALCCVALAGQAAPSAFDQGRMYRNGEGVRRDPVRAFRLIGAAAEAGNADAMFTLSNMLAAGEGTAPDAKAAMLWLERAASLECAAALQQLALNLQDGLNGYPVDRERAAQLMRDAAHAARHAAGEAKR